MSSKPLDSITCQHNRIVLLIPYAADSVITMINADIAR
jgi:hypothetical protein